MALPSSGAISLNQMHTEVGGTSGTTASINDSDIRGLANKSSGAQMSFNEWHGLFYNQRSITFTCGNTTWTPSGSKFANVYYGWDPAGYFLSGAPVSSIGSGSPQYVRYNGNRIIRVLACVENRGFLYSVQLVFDSVSPALTIGTGTTLQTALSLPSGYLTSSGNTVRYQLNSPSFFQDSGTTRYRTILNYRDISFPSVNNAGGFPSSGSFTLTFS